MQSQAKSGLVSSIRVSSSFLGESLGAFSACSRATRQPIPTQSLDWWKDRKDSAVEPQCPFPNRVVAGKAIFNPPTTPTTHTNFRTRQPASSDKPRLTRPVTCGCVRGVRFMQKMQVPYGSSFMCTEPPRRSPFRRTSPRVCRETTQKSRSLRIDARRSPQ